MTRLRMGAPVTAPQDAPERGTKPVPSTSGEKVLKPARQQAGFPRAGEAPSFTTGRMSHFFRPVGRATYTIGQCRCSTHNENLASLFTLGVKEYIVDGRIGLCRDHATQQTWPVLLAPSVRLISAPDTTSGRVVSDHETTHPNDHQQEQTTDCDPNKPDSIGSCQPSLSLLDRDDNTETTAAKPTGRNSDE